MLTCATDATRSGIGLLGGVADGLLPSWDARHARDLEAVLHEDQRWPQLDAEGAAERPAGAIFDLQVPQVGVRGQALFDDGLGGGTEAAPVGAELDHRRTRQGIDFSARRRASV